MTEPPKDVLRDIVLDKLLFGHQLSKEETDYYNLHKDEPDFQNDLQFLTDMRGPLSIENRPLLKAQLKEKEQQILKSKKVIRLMPTLAIAASFLALIAVSFLFWPSQTNSELFSSHYEAYPSIINPIVKGEQTAASVLDEAMVDYQQSNFNKASQLLESINSKTDTVSFYLAMSQIELNQIPAAQQNLELIDEQTSRFYLESQWYRALLFLKQGQDTEAKAQLQLIANTQQHPYLDEASRLLSEMK